MNSVCSVFFHNYYGEHQTWLDYFTQRLSIPTNLYYNLVEDSMYNIDSKGREFLRDDNSTFSQNIRQVVMREAPNKGKDIGGKLILLDAYLRLAAFTEYGLFLHDKKSPYKANNGTWADNLLKITAQPFMEQAVGLLSGDPTVGIVTALGNTADEYNYDTGGFVSSNNVLLPGLQRQYNINPPVYGYVTGTMFWFRLQPLQKFFEEHPPLQIREMLEKGNVTDDIKGTYTHCWERLLCWIITAAGFKIKTI